MYTRLGVSENDSESVDALLTLVQQSLPCRGELAPLGFCAPLDSAWSLGRV